MSVAAVMMVKDEADIIEYTIKHLLSQVDYVYVSDNTSTDGTREQLDALERRDPHRLTVIDDPEVAYFQHRKTTALADTAREAGFDWVVPCDADEMWRTNDGQRLGDLLDLLEADVLFARAALYDHKVTSLDPPHVANPFVRMGWRFVNPGALPKVACRLVEGLEIGMGNHEATVPAGRRRVSSTGSPPNADGLIVVEHYSWRSADQLLRKARNGYLAYEAAGPELEDFGNHWKAFGHPDGERFEVRARSWFDSWAYAEDPGSDEEIGYFPAMRG